jgi:hypothetical protein
MLAIYLTWTSSDIIEVAVTMVLIAVVMACFAAIPFIAEYYIDDRRDESE